MSKLVIVNAATLEKMLFYLGYTKVRQKGSHCFYRHSDGRYTTIPFHSNRDLSRPIIRAIIRQIGIDVHEHNQLIKSIN